MESSSTRQTLEQRAQEAMKRASSNLVATFDLYNIDPKATIIGMRFGNEEEGAQGILFQGSDEDVIELLEAGIEQVRRTAEDRSGEGDVKIHRARSKEPSDSRELDALTRVIFQETDLDEDAALDLAGKVQSVVDYVRGRVE